MLDNPPIFVYILCGLIYIITGQLVLRYPQKKLMPFMAIVLRAQKEVKPIGILHKKNRQNTSSNRVITAF